MPELKWCPNCNQNVAPQVIRKNRAGIFLLLLALGGFLFLATPFLILGIVVLAVAAIYLVIGLIAEVGTLKKGAYCPICKAHNLLDEKPTT